MFLNVVTTISLECNMFFKVRFTPCIQGVIQAEIMVDSPISDF